MIVFINKAMSRFKRFYFNRIPLHTILKNYLFYLFYENSSDYWNQRYLNGGSSGDGSRGRLAEQKSDYVKGIIDLHGITSAIDFGCGDGSQLSEFINSLESYIGYEVSPYLVSKLEEQYGGEGRYFYNYKSYNGSKAELSLSLDVIYHLIEDSVFEDYMRNLFNSSMKFVLIYSSNTAYQHIFQPRHIYHRDVTTWISNNIDNFKFVEYVCNKYPYMWDGNKETSFCDFYLYKRDDHEL